MSEPNDPPPPPNPPDEGPPSSPFPESSLTPPAEPEPASAPPPPADPPGSGVPAPPPPSDPPAFDVPSPPPAEPPPPSASWMEPSGPQAPPPGEPLPTAPPAGGLVSGDPLGGSAQGFGNQLVGAPPSGESAFPGGYTSPPPPGAGGAFSGSPAPGAGTYVLAGWWRRVGAAIIDGIIVTIVALVIMIPLGIGLFSTAEVSETDTDLVGQIVGFVLAMLVIAVVALAYAPVMMGKTNGKTLGRMATGIRVVRANGERITVGFAAIREVAVKLLLINTIAGAVSFGLAGLLDVLWPLWDDENRALHDFVVNTRTVMDQ